MVHQGPQGWTAARRLSELIDLSAEQRALFAEHLPELRLTIDDLALHSEEQVRRRSMDALTVLTLLLMRDLQSSDDILASLSRWLDLFERVAVAPTSPDAMEALLGYTLGTTDVSFDAVFSLIRPHVAETEAQTMITTAQKLYDEGLAKGLEKGREEGVEKGLEKGREEVQVRTLLRTIARLDGEPSAEVRRRVEEASIDERDRWLERIFEAKTVEELLA